ncbi:hypothetical protein [Virgibacillus sp. 6R]|uniref:hypothetical protein n=1 Tax=Metabacillus sp. 22489 TaxID=3453928 RepID=UPI00164242B0
MEMQDYLSREIKQIKNERGDEIEVEVRRYEKHYHAIATICEDKPPFKDYFAEATDRKRMNALRKALKDLYEQAYSYPTMQFILYPRKNDDTQGEG